MGDGLRHPPGPAACADPADLSVSALQHPVRFDDPDIGIDWGLGELKPCLSDKDSAAPFLRDLKSPFTYEATA